MKHVWLGGLAGPADDGHERERKPAAVPHNQVLLSERPVVAGSREPVKPRPDAFSDGCRG